MTKENENQYDAICKTLEGKVFECTDTWKNVVRWAEEMREKEDVKEIRIKWIKTPGKQRVTK